MSILRPTKRELAELRAAEDFQRGIPHPWQRLICPGCGADFATRSGPLIFDPCGNCGSHMGVITSRIASWGT